MTFISLGFGSLPCHHLFHTSSLGLLKSIRFCFSILLSRIILMLLSIFLSSDVILVSNMLRIVLSASLLFFLLAVFFLRSISGSLLLSSSLLSWEIFPVAPSLASISLHSLSNMNIFCWVSQIAWLSALLLSVLFLSWILFLPAFSPRLPVLLFHQDYSFLN